MPDTIPGMLAAAAERDPDGDWLRTDDDQLTFAAAAALVARAATRLLDAGVARGDRIVLTARTTPSYLLAWLAVCSTGAVAVPTNPAGKPTELAGLLSQVRPRLVLSDPELKSLVHQAAQQLPSDPAVLDVDEVVGDWRQPLDAADWPLRLEVSATDLAVLIPT
ncbi:MAG: fatty-acyl-CoA synthase, partial [Frankiaceae bacterium]|nr:fatty-acyl-CoA synthase [Frankiaceae bacterium]